jgi:hypothetical protein
MLICRTSTLLDVSLFSLLYVAAGIFRRGIFSKHAERSFIFLKDPLNSSRNWGYHPKQKLLNQHLRFTRPPGSSLCGSHRCLSFIVLWIVVFVVIRYFESPTSYMNWENFFFLKKRTCNKFLEQIAQVSKLLRRFRKICSTVLLDTARVEIVTFVLPSTIRGFHRDINGWLTS